MTDETERNPWDQMDGESNFWHQRFIAFKLMGVGRSVLECANQARDQKGQRRTKNIPGTWRKAVELWQWRPRAEAWDKYLSAKAEAEVEATWKDKIMGATENLGRLSEFGRNDISNFFKESERWTEEPLPADEIVREEQFDKPLPRGGSIPATRYLVRRVVMDMDALLNPELSWRVKKFSDSPRSGLSIELYDAHGALGDIGKHHNLFDQSGNDSRVDIGAFMLPADCMAPTFLDAYDDIKAHAHTEYVFHGGRGSTKSSFISLVIIWLIKNNPTMHAIALRQVGNTLRDSVYSQLEWAINELGLSDQFKCTVSPLEIEYRPTGQKIYFRGADEPGKIKSIKPAFGYIGIAWFEELDQFKGPEAIRNIEQSAIRGGDLAYIFKSFNPPRTVANWANKYVQVPKANQFQHHSTYIELGGRIKWLGKPWIEEAEHIKLINPRAYEHEYLGVANGTGGMVFENVTLRTITDEEIGQFDHVTWGGDWGYYPDPADFGPVHYDAARRRLFIFGEYRAWKQSNLALYTELVRNKGLLPDTLLILDSAEPKSVADFRQYSSDGVPALDAKGNPLLDLKGKPVLLFGPTCRGAEKGPESVNYSIKWMQGLTEIVVDPQRAPYAAEEFINYEYEQDSDDNFISEYPDKDNHSIDRVRYATNLIWRRRGQ